MMIARKGDWLSAKVGDELVMMSVSKGKYLGLSDVGARIWELIETPRSFDDVMAALLSEFDVTAETCRAEVETFLKDLASHDAISLDPVPSA